MPRPDENQKGMALLIVIWALVLMIAIATQFAVTMKTDVNATRNYKENIESYHLAKAGVQLGVAEVLTEARYHADDPEEGLVLGTMILVDEDGEEIEANGDSKDAEDAEEILEALPVHRKDLPLGSGTVTYSIIDENRKVPINTASRKVLVKALEFVGLEIGEERDIIADSILDWIDKDNNHRVNGAEEDYYKKQNPPYRPRNGKITILEELLKVRGMTEEIFYGKEDGDSKEQQGFQQFFTVLNIPRVNPNTASGEVLSLMFDETRVEEILQKRAEEGYYNTSLSTHFRIESTGQIQDGGTRHTVTAVVERAGTNDKPFLITHYWNDNVIHYETDLF